MAQRDAFSRLTPQQQCSSEPRHLVRPVWSRRAKSLVVPKYRQHFAVLPCYRHWIALCTHLSRWLVSFRSTRRGGGRTCVCSCGLAILPLARCPCCSRAVGATTGLASEPCKPSSVMPTPANGPSLMQFHIVCQRSPARGSISRIVAPCSHSASLPFAVAAPGATDPTPPGGARIMVHRFL